MNICLISRAYPPETGQGGIATYTYHLAHSLAKFGHKVYVVSRSLNNKDMYYKDKKVHVFRIGRISISWYLSRIPGLEKILSGPVIGDIFNIFFVYKLYRKVCEINKYNKIDIVEAPELLAEGLFVSFDRKLRLITRLHTPSFLLKKINKKKFGFLNVLTHFFEKIQTKNSTGISSPSKALADIISRDWEIDLKNIDIIPNPINFNIINELSENKNILQLKDYLLFFGNLEKRKGLHILLKALKKVFLKHPNQKMVFIGSGPLKNKLIEAKNIYKSNIIILDNLTRDKLFPIIKDATLVIAPSLWEAFGYVCLEAMSLGKVVIATRGSGFEEIIQDNYSGFLVKPNDDVELANKINECLERKDLNKIAKNAKARAAQFETSNIVNRYIDYYQKIIRLRKV